MVERLEGFCSEKDWKRAYNEINEFERVLSDWGAVVLKFWIHIDSDTQLERFTARQNTPERIAQMIGADSLGFFPAARLAEPVGGIGLCSACFTGEYPTPIPADTRKDRFERKLSEATD